MDEGYEKVLVAVDGSEAAKDAFNEAVNVARRNHAKLFVISVVDYKFSIGDPAFINDSLKFHLNNATIEMEQLLSDMTVVDELEMETKVDSGSPKRKIVDYALENQVDLIMVGATGRGAVERAFLGSTSAYVVNHATCDVMVVRP